MELQSQVILVTGGTDGIGKALVAALLNEGAQVVLCGLSDGPRPEFDQTRSHTVYCDITDPSAQRRFIDEALSRFGRIDALINNAGVGLYLPAHQSPIDLTRRMFDTNVFAPLELVQLALPHLRRSPGAMIVNLSSVGAWAALPWATMYCSTKYALHCLSEGLHRELKSEGIHVLTVIPGIVRTSFRTSVLSGLVPRDVEQISGVLSADELARAIVAGMRARRRYVVKPWTALPFGLLNWLLPGIVDRYCRSKDPHKV